MPVKERIQELLRKYHTHTATEAETREMFTLMNEYETIFSEEMSAFFLSLGGMPEKGLLRKLPYRRSSNRSRWMAAASVILLLSLVIFYVINSGTKQPSVASSVVHDSIYPGADKATLILADGRRIQLKGQKTISDGSLKIQNINNQLIYAEGDKVTINTMQTPYGGQYRLQLADGTKVWLNAGSAITYPSSFSGTQRIVELQGEAFFEVATNKSKPFLVKAGGETVEVLGTHFNINAYSNEPALQTTLLEGAIRIHDRILRPGEAWSSGKVKKVNTAQVVAWKNGLFNFENATLQELMRQFERWYDIRVVYDNTDKNNIIFKGEMYRSVKFTDVMEFLQRMGVKCRMEGKTLIVY